jgi:hypothetical protein
MNAVTDLRTLLSEIENTRSVLRRIDLFYRDFLARERVAETRKPEHAIVIAEVLANIYTCLETAFLRISQAFENSLAPARWHQELLDKMTLRIEGIREPVLGNDTHALLLELLKFRHFKRYYVEFEYDWDRIDYLQRKYEQLQPLIARDFERFTAFLRATERRAGNDI